MTYSDHYHGEHRVVVLQVEGAVGFTSCAVAPGRGN